MTWPQRLSAAALLLAVSSVPASADDVRPIQIQIREREPGAFLVQWRVPKLLPIQAMPNPVLPEECVAEGERILLDQPASWVISRGVFQFEPSVDHSTYKYSPLSNPAVLRAYLICISLNPSVVIAFSIHADFFSWAL